MNTTLSNFNQIICHDSESLHLSTDVKYPKLNLPAILPPFPSEDIETTIFADKERHYRRVQCTY